MYRGIPIFRASKGSENWFENSESSRNRDKVSEEGKRLLVRIIETFEKLRVPKIEIIDSNVFGLLIS